MSKDLKFALPNKTTSNGWLLVVQLVMLAGLLYQPIFGHIDQLSIRLWDESRLAVNAQEMFVNNNFLVTYFEGKPDMWNTKPPLLIILQVYCMKLVGVNELAIRLPSAIAALLTCLILLVISHKLFKTRWFGFIAILILITSPGYVSIHGTRTGDYDSLLTLFTTLSSFSFFFYVHTKAHKYLYAFFILLALAVLTKSISGLLFTPALALYCVLQKRLVATLKSKHVYIGCLIFIFLVGGYYLLREAYNPGYLEAVYDNELGGRYLEALEGNDASFWFYHENFMFQRLPFWYILVPCGLLVGFTIHNQKMRNLTLFSFIMLFSFLLIISSAKTKLAWYDLPLYPFISITVAIFIFYVFEHIKNGQWFNKTLKINLLPFAFLFVLVLSPYRKMISETFLPKETPYGERLYELSYLLRDVLEGKHQLEGNVIAFDGYAPYHLFYTNALKRKGINVLIKYWENIEINDVVISKQPHIKEYIEQHYNTELISTKGNITTHKINGRKE